MMTGRIGKEPMEIRTPPGTGKVVAEAGQVARALMVNQETLVIHGQTGVTLQTMAAAEGVEQV